MLYLMRGYSGSGKSTYARTVAHETGAVVANRDTIRSSVFGAKGKTVLNPRDEQKVTELQEGMVKAALDAGYSVVIDDTNLRAKYARRWLTIAHNRGVEWKVLDLHTLPEECQRRNALRFGGDRVPEHVIETQARKFPIGRWPHLEPDTALDGATWEPYVPNWTLPRSYVFDIDGTLADSSHRDPYDAAKASNDGLMHYVADVLGSLEFDGAHIVFLSGRDEKYRTITSDWLNYHLGLAGPLYMRPEGDRRNDAIVKSELFDEHVAPFYNVRGVFDDRLRVVRMWHARGIPVFRVGDPDADF